MASPVADGRSIHSQLMHTAIPIVQAGVHPQSAAAAGIGAFNDRLNPAPFPGAAQGGPHGAAAGAFAATLPVRIPKAVLTVRRPT